MVSYGSCYTKDGQYTSSGTRLFAYTIIYRALISNSCQCGKARNECPGGDSRVLPFARLLLASQ